MRPRWWIPFSLFLVCPRMKGLILAFCVQGPRTPKSCNGKERGTNACNKMPPSLRTLRGLAPVDCN